MPGTDPYEQLPQAVQESARIMFWSALCAAGVFVVALLVSALP